MSAKILLLDIETAPNVGYTWGKWEQNVIKFVRQWYMLSFAYKWFGTDKTLCRALPDYDEYKSNKENDYFLVRDLWDLLDEADIVIAHNGDSFDIKKINTKMAIHDLPPPSTYKTVDTLKVLKKHFKFESNNLSAIGEDLKLGQKVAHSGFALWEGCMAGDKKSWDMMKMYNIGDVDLLEKVYLRLRQWSPSHPNVNLYDKTEHLCPTCGSNHVQRRGFSYAKTQVRQRYNCLDCGSWYSGKLVKKSELDG